MEENSILNGISGDSDEIEAGGSGADGETKAEKFSRLAQARVNKTIHDIESIGKLSGSAYEYTPEQVDKMFSAMQGALDAAKAKYEKKTESKSTFSF